MRPGVFALCAVLFAGCASSELSKSPSSENLQSGETPGDTKEPPSGGAMSAPQDSPRPNDPPASSGAAGMGTGEPDDETDDPALGMTGGTGGSVPIAGMGGDEWFGSTQPVCEAAGAFDPFVARDGEVCYELLVHDGSGISPFIVQTGESYNQLYYDIPWPEDSVATRFGGDYDNLDVLQKWHAFDLPYGEHGQVERNVLGTTLFMEATLFATWSVGGCNFELPADAGIALASPSSGKKLMIQWHHMNYTGVSQPDASKVQICVVPRSTRTNVVGLTVLGTESVPSVDPGDEASVGGACKNDSTEPINIVALWPYMHGTGTRASAEIIRADGTLEAVFDLPFAHGAPSLYTLEPNAILQPGDRIRAECTYFNDTMAPVAFGQSVAQEQCAQYALSYPLGALDHEGTASLLGALNTCWGD